MIDYEGYENEERFLRSVTNCHGSDVSAECKKRIAELEQKGEDITAEDILQDLLQVARRRTPVFPGAENVRFR